MFSIYQIFRLRRLSSSSQRFSSGENFLPLACFLFSEQYTFRDSRFLNFIAQRNPARVRSLARAATDSGRALALASRLPGKQLKVQWFRLSVALSLESVCLKVGIVI